MSEKIFVELRKYFNRRTQRGFSMLETAIIVPAVLMFTLGSIDVANYYRSYHTAKQAASAGIRCLYPTDSGCTSVSPAITIPQNNLYIPPFFSNMFDYDGREKKLLLPNYSYGALRASVLQDVSYQANKRVWRADKPWFNGLGTAKILTLNVPRVVGNAHHLRLSNINDGASIENVTSHGELGSFRECRNLPSVSGNQLGDSYGRIQFRVPDRSTFLNDPDLALISHCKTVKGNSLDSRQLDCDTDLLTSAKIYFKLNGVAANSLLNNQAASTRAAAHLNLKYSVSVDGGATWQAKAALGGQGFSNEGSANFYPRGFTTQELSNLDGNTLNLAYGGITAPWGSLVRVQLYISSATGNDENGIPYVCPSNQKIRWQFDSADVRVARPAVRTSNGVMCGNRLFKSACDSAQCETGAPLNFGLDLDSNEFITDYDIFRPSCSAPQGVDKSAHASCATATESTEALTSSNLDYRDNKADYDDALDLGAANCNSNASRNCEPNFGGITVAQKITACPAIDPMPGTESWTERTIEVIPAGQINLSSQNCQFNPSLPLSQDLIPPNAQQYLKLVLPTASLNGHTQMNTAQQDPSILKQDPLYACAAVRTEQRDFKEGEQDSFTSEEWQRLLASSFNGPVQQMNCSSTDNLRSQAIGIGMSALSFYETIKAAQIPYSEYLVSLNQIDSCMTVRADGSLVTTNLRSKVPGGPFDEGLIPSQCVIQGQNKCISIPAGVRQVEASGQSQIDTALVKRKAQLAAKAFMPNACADCVTIDPQNRLRETVGEHEMTTQPLELEVNVKQPLLVLAGREVNVSYTASRFWEGRYASR